MLKIISLISLIGAYTSYGHTSPLDDPIQGLHPSLLKKMCPKDLEELRKICASKSLDRVRSITANINSYGKSLCADLPKNVNKTGIVLAFFEHDFSKEHVSVLTGLLTNTMSISERIALIQAVGKSGLSPINLFKISCCFSKEFPVHERVKIIEHFRDLKLTDQQIQFITSFILIRDIGIKGLYGTRARL